MLIDLVKPLAAGEKIPVTLTVIGKDGKKAAVEVKAEVLAVGATPAKH
jgi:hypothetical protein